MSVRSLQKSQSDWRERKNEGAYEGFGKAIAAKKNQQFIEDCKQEDVEPTARQYAKWSKKSTQRWQQFRRAS